MTDTPGTAPHDAALEELAAVFETELKRGALTLAILSRLDTAQYGYSLLQTLTEQGIDIEAGTLYPMLRRLEKQGVLTCRWDTGDSRPRKYYELSPLGVQLYARLADSWSTLNRQMAELITGGKPEL